MCRGLHVLVNNAGAGYVRPVLDIDIAVAQRTHDINLWGALRTIQAFVNLLIASRGRIVNVSSSASVVNSPWFCTFGPPIPTFLSFLYRPGLSCVSSSVPVMYHLGNLLWL